MDNELVDIETFIQQVWDIEGVKIRVKVNGVKHLVRPYTYERLPDDATVDDLNKRVNLLLNKPFNYNIRL
jgi:hypothetical protein